MSSSTRPYLIRAIYEWTLDNGLTPYLLVNARAPGARVPERYVDKGKIVLNIGPQAVQALELGNEQVSFQARFGGTPMAVEVPTPAVLAVYARETGQGMLFEEGEEPPPDPDPDPGAGPDGGGRRRPSLKVVK